MVLFPFGLVSIRAKSKNEALKQALVLDNVISASFVYSFIKENLDYATEQAIFGYA